MSPKTESRESCLRAMLRWQSSRSLRGHCRLPSLRDLAVGLLAVLFPFVPFAAVADNPASPMSEALPLVLKYQPNGFSLSVSVDLGSREVRFKKEPDFSNHTVVRGAIPVGKGRSEFAGFAWDQTEGSLYVDTNRDLDLTGEAGQPYHSSTDAFVSSAFNGIHLTLEHEGIPVPYVFGLEFIGSWYCVANVISGWQAVTEIDGVAYRVELADNLNGSLGEGDSFQVKRVEPTGPKTTAAAQIAPRSPFPSNTMGIPECIVVDGNTYSIRESFTQTPDGTAIQVALRPPDAPVGELRIEGQHLQELVLGKNNRPSVLYLSGNPIRVPTGTYTVYSATLEGGWRTDQPQTGHAAAVQSQSPATLRVGGPLKQDVGVTRFGNTLNLEYSVRGVGGETYQGPESRLNPPQFAVYRGDTRVASGTFEYG